jgi:ABC-type uncharacterized transport system substrate-binding protein
MTAEKKMLNQLKEIERLDKLSSDLMDTDEDASDKAYDKMWALAEDVANLISKSTFGQITRKTALYMVFHKREKLIALCKKFA